MFRNEIQADANITARITHLLGVVQRAAQSNRRVFLRYRKESGEESTRLVEPETVWSSSAGDVLLTGPDAARGDDVRTFRLDRVVSAEVDA